MAILILIMGLNLNKIAPCVGKSTLLLLPWKASLEIYIYNLFLIVKIKIHIPEYYFQSMFAQGIEQNDHCYGETLLKVFPLVLEFIKYMLYFYGTSSLTTTFWFLHIICTINKISNYVVFYLMFNLMYLLVEHFQSMPENYI